MLHKIVCLGLLLIVTDTSRYKQNAYTDACETCHTVTVYYRLPEDEPSGSKYVEDKK